MRGIRVKGAKHQYVGLSHKIKIKYFEVDIKNLEKFATGVLSVPICEISLENKIITKNNNTKCNTDI